MQSLKNSIRRKCEISGKISVSLPYPENSQEKFLCHPVNSLFGAWQNVTNFHAKRKFPDLQDADYFSSYNVTNARGYPKTTKSSLQAIFKYFTRYSEEVSKRSAYQGFMLNLLGKKWQRKFFYFVLKPQRWAIYPYW